MHIYIYIYNVYAYLYIYVSTHIYKRVRISYILYTSDYILVCLHTSIYVHTDIFIHAQTHSYTHIRTNAITLQMRSRHFFGPQNRCSSFEKNTLDRTCSAHGRIWLCARPGKWIGTRLTQTSQVWMPLCVSDNSKVCVTHFESAVFGCMHAAPPLHTSWRKWPCTACVRLYMCVCVRVCVSEWVRERENERKRERICVCECVCVCALVLGEHTCVHEQQQF